MGACVGHVGKLRPLQVIRMKKLNFIFVRCVLPIVFFIFVASYRCILETRYWAAHPFFSYYTLLHHVLWVACMILMIVGLAHCFLREPPARLLWLFYGSGVLIIPLLWATVTQESLALCYMNDSPARLLLHTVTFNWTYPPNRPLTVELIAIFVGMLAIGFYRSHSVLRALGLPVCVHVVGCLFAIHWFGCAPYATSFIKISTAMGNHILLSVIYTVIAGVLVLALLFRQHRESSGVSLKTVLGSILVWAAGAFVARVYVTHCSHVVDAMAMALPLAFVAFLVMSIRYYRRKRCHISVLVSVSILVLVASLVTIPFTLNCTEGLLPVLSRTMP